MRPTFATCLSLVCTLALLAQDPAWMNKPAAQWTDEDAKQVLADSPWSGVPTVTFMAGKNEDKLREGGKWASDRPAAPLSALGQHILSGIGAKPYVYQTPDPPPLKVVWGSALPVRQAETKLGATGTSDWDSYYVIAVFGIPNSVTDSKRDGLIHGLKQMADLRLDGKRVLKPARVTVVATGDSTSAVIYQFPRSQEIGKKDERVAFVAQINRLYVTQYFYPPQMIFAGSIEL
ncbi:MAG: hypothetical protein JO307_26610 [Bryobacterales bacterium]|nr:hypothetical protein [Bryobacterales bacterium]MBV9400014.1 hypothetical protein [Bryobacterales bacterium]